jgi:hypothetical protein
MSPWETRPEYLSRKYNINIELVGLIQRRVERDTSSDSSELSSSLLEKIVRLYSEEGFYLSKDQLQLYVEYMKAQQGLIQGGEAAAVRKQWFDLAPNKGIEGIVSINADLIPPYV